MQVTYLSITERYVGNIGHPKLVGCHGDKILDQIFPLVVAVIGIRGAPCLGRRKHQTVMAKQGEEAVSSHHLVSTINITKHQPKLVTADARILFTDFTHVGQQTGVTFHFCGNVGLGLVLSLTATAKQTAREGDAMAAILHQFRHCLAPDFFLIGMLK